VAVRDGRIIKAGGADEIKKLAGPSTRMVDLGGKAKCGPVHQDGVWFVTRLKSNSSFEVIQTLEISVDGPVRADQPIRLSPPGAGRLS